MSYRHPSMVRRYATFLVLLFACVPTLQAQSPPVLQVVPNPGLAGSLLSVHVEDFNRPCHRMTSFETARQGQTVTLTLRYESIAACVPLGLPPPMPPWVLPLGTFEPGQYTLVLLPIHRTLGAQPSSTTAFQVVPGAPTPITVPTVGSWLLAIMAGMLAALGALAQRRGRRNSR